MRFPRTGPRSGGVSALIVWRFRARARDIGQASRCSSLADPDGRRGLQGPLTEVRTLSVQSRSSAMAATDVTRTPATHDGNGNPGSRPGTARRLVTETKAAFKA